MKLSTNSTLLLLTITLNMLFGYQRKVLITNIFKSCQSRNGCNALFSSLSSKTAPLPNTDAVAVAVSSSQIQANEYLFGLEPSLFSEIPSIHPMISQALSFISRDYATLIQQKSLPQLLENNDVVISSETGSGKTLTYLIPLFQRSLEAALASSSLSSTSTASSTSTSNNAEGDVDSYLSPSVQASSYSTSYSSKYPQAVILVPNKDLAAQVVNMSKTFSGALFSISNIQITVGALTRNVGNDRWPYAHSGNCPNILVCTPVMISNFVRGPIVTDEELFKNIKQIVFDEADMLVEGSYLIETQKILEALKKTRREMIRKKEIPVHRRVCQFILSAATLPSSGKYSISSYVKKTFPNATMVRNEHVHRLHPKITQEFIKVHGMTSEGSWSDARVKLLVKAILNASSNSGTRIDTADAENTVGDYDANSQQQAVTIAAATTKLGSSIDDNNNSDDIKVEKNNKDDWSLDELFTDGTSFTATTGGHSSHQNSSNQNNENDDVITITPEMHARIPQTMVFANEVETVKKLAYKLNQYGLKTVEFHKALQPSLKEMYLQLFQEGVNKVMVCTDSASRGLDLPYVQHVVQAEFATNVVQYLHRVGRCSRAGKQGRATNFYDIHSEDLVNTILDDSIGSGSGSNNRYGIDGNDDDDEDENDGEKVVVDGADVDDLSSSDNGSESEKANNDEVVIANKLISTVVKNNITVSTVITTPSVTQAFSRRRGLRQKFKRALKDQEEIENQGGIQSSSDIDSGVDDFMNEISNDNNDTIDRNNDNNGSQKFEPKIKNYGDYDDSNDDKDKKKKISPSKRQYSASAGTSSNSGNVYRRDYHSDSRPQSQPQSSERSNSDGQSPPATTATTTRPAASWSKSANRDTAATTTRDSNNGSNNNGSGKSATNNDANMYDWENFEVALLS